MKLKEYVLIRDVLYHFDKDGKIINSLTILNEEWLKEIRKTLRAHDDLYFAEISAVTRNLDRRNQIYFEQLFKLFGKPVGE